jgi:protein SCO1/2
MRRTSLLAGIALVALAAAALALGGRLAAREPVYRGGLIDPPLAAPDVALNDQYGRPFRLSAERGKAVLIFFGYSSCIDVCPLTLGRLKATRAELGEQASALRVVFITTDPEVDTPARLADYLAAFDPAFVGLSGSAAELEPAWRGYGVYQEKHHGTGVVDHTSRIYLVDPAGRLRLTYTADADPADLAADIRLLLGAE